MTDSLGVVRYDLYRATRQGSYAETLPLAANDPAGAWTISVRELLDNHEGSASLTNGAAAAGPGAGRGPASRRGVRKRPGQRLPLCSNAARGDDRTGRQSLQCSGRPTAVGHPRDRGVHCRTRWTWPRQPSRTPSATRMR